MTNLLISNGNINLLKTKNVHNLALTQLNSNYDKIVIVCFELLANYCVDNTDFISTVVNTTHFSKIFYFLQTNTIKEVFSTTTWILNVLLPKNKIKECPIQILKLFILITQSILETAITSEINTYYINEYSEILKIVSRIIENEIPEILSVFDLTKFINCCYYSKSNPNFNSLIVFCLRILGNLTCCEGYNVNNLMNLNYLDFLYQCLKGETDSKIQKEIFWQLSNIAADSIENIIKLYHHEIFKYQVYLIQNGNLTDEVLFEASYSLFNLLIVDNNEIIKFYQNFDNLLIIHAILMKLQNHSSLPKMVKEFYDHALINLKNQEEVDTFKNNIQIIGFFEIQNFTILFENHSPSDASNINNNEDYSSDENSS